MATVYKKVSKAEFDEQIKYCLARFVHCVNAKYNDDKKHSIRECFWLHHSISNTFLSYYKYGKVYAFKCNRSDLNNENVEANTTNIYSSRTLRKYIPDITDKKCFGAHEVFRDGKKKIDWSIKPVVAKIVTPAAGIYEHCYCYDVNSAYLASYLKPMPKIDSLKLYSIVGENQVGFDISGIPHIADGKEHMFVFDLEINNKLAEYAQDKFLEYTKAKINYKNNPTKDNLQKKIDIKFQYTAGNGCIKNFNIFYYNMILWYAKVSIEQFIDNTTLYVSTDSIVSTHKLDLPIGDNLGDFKVEHEDETYIATDTAYGFKGYETKQKGAHEHTTGLGFVLDWQNEKEIDKQLTLNYLNKRRDLYGKKS